MSTSSDQNSGSRKDTLTLIIGLALVLATPIYCFVDLVFVGKMKMPVDDIVLLALTLFSMLMGIFVWLRKPAGVILSKITFVLWPVYIWWAHAINPGENGMAWAISVTIVAIFLLIIGSKHSIEE